MAMRICLCSVLRLHVCVKMQYGIFADSMVHSNAFDGKDSATASYSPISKWIKYVHPFVDKQIPRRLQNKLQNANKIIFSMRSPGTTNIILAQFFFNLFPFWHVIILCIYDLDLV